MAKDSTQLLSGGLQADADRQGETEYTAAGQRKIKSRMTLLWLIGPGQILAKNCRVDQLLSSFCMCMYRWMICSLVSCNMSVIEYMWLNRKDDSARQESIHIV